MAPTKKSKVTVNPAWFAATAKLAMKHGTAIIFAKTGEVYGIVPNKGGSVNVFYPVDKEWTDYVLSVFPQGAVFPSGCMFGGAGVGKALRAYANLRMPSEGDGTAWIDPVTAALHVKGAGATLHSSAFEANDTPAPQEAQLMEEFRFECEATPKDMVKRLAEFTARDDNRPYLKRIFRYENARGVFLGATDGKSGVLHAVEDVPHGFSVDPTVVQPADIVAYMHETTDSGADIHTYRLADGTTVIEKLANVKPKDLAALIGNVGGMDKIPLVSADSLALLAEDITSLGLGANDSWGGVVRFESRSAVVLSNGQPVADFDVTTGLPEGRTAAYSLQVIRRFASFGADLQVTAKEDNVAYAHAGSATMLASPICFAAPKTEEPKVK